MSALKSTFFKKRQDSDNYHVIHESMAARILWVAKENTLTYFAHPLTQQVQSSRKQEQRG